jgi:hypothetical protein
MRIFTMKTMKEHEGEERLLPSSCLFMPFMVNSVSFFA